jgi:phage terminase Nu1 subunit (DNA packaging protein)
MSNQSGLNAEAIAKLLDLSERRVRQLVREGVLPKPEGGKHDLVGSVRAYVRFLRSRIESGNLDVQQERAALLRVQRERQAFELRRRQGELIPLHELERALSHFIVSTRARLLALPRRLASVVDTDAPRVVEGKIEIVIRDLLDELAVDDRLLPEVADKEPDTPRQANCAER